MHLVEWLQRIMVGFGAAWVMWLLIGLSVISVAIILERIWYFSTTSTNLEALKKELHTALEKSVAEAIKHMDASPSAEAAVVAAGLRSAKRGVEAANHAMDGEAAVWRMRLERRLAYLGTLGNNAPFIGLLGTVIGVVQAFEALGETAKQPLAEQAAQALAPQAVMYSIAEALVATAVGLAVAIPAVAANNVFQRIVKTRLANTQALSSELLSFLKDENREDEADEEEEKPVKAAKKTAKKGSSEGAS